MPFGLGIWEIVILAGILVLLFGAKGAPGMAKKLGVGVKELKDAVGDLDPRTFIGTDGETPAKAPQREIEATPARPVGSPGTASRDDLPAA
jgi:TatA/E family protein of Tat protein translocase